MTTLTTYEELQLFFKAQSARNPWAIAWAIVGGPNSKPASPGLQRVREMYASRLAAVGDDVEKRKSLAASIARAIGTPTSPGNAFNQ